MTEVISVRFKNNSKVYFFDPNGVVAQKGQHVVVETSKGQEYAECAEGNHGVEDSTVIKPLRPVLRVATAEDTARAEGNKQREEEAFRICQEKIASHGIDMKLVDVEYSFDGSKIIFFFTSEGRVDFRDLVKDLAGVFRTRIELRQIGIRDEARMLGGLGICGRPFCCVQFLDDFQPVSIKMAKTQGLSLNPTKISGTCGRLMCCLKYEQEAYEELVKHVPKVDAFVQTPLGKGSVVDVNLLRGNVRVRLEDTVDPTIKTFDGSEVEVLGGKAKRAEYLALKAEGKGDPIQPKKVVEAHISSVSETAPAPGEELPEEKPETVSKPEAVPEKAAVQHQHGRRNQRRGNQKPGVKQEASGEKRPHGEREKSETVIHHRKKRGRGNPRPRGEGSSHSQK